MTSWCYSCGRFHRGICPLIIAVIFLVGMIISAGISYLIMNE